MDEEKYEEQLQYLSEEIDDNEYFNPNVIENCMFDCGQTPDVAWKLGYERPYGRTAYTGWIYVCDCCDGESRKLAPYWWNKALRGESLDEEE
jgi:hypothetical protein